MMEGEDIYTVPLGDNVELERHGEMPYIDDTDFLGYVPDSYDDLSAQIVDDSLIDFVPDSEEEEEYVVIRSPMKKVEVTSNKWKASTLVYRRRQSKNVGAAEQSSIQSISSARKAIREEHRPTITLVYRRRRKNVGVGECSSIQSLSSARNTNNEHCEAEKCVSASSHAPKIGMLTLEEEILQYEGITRMNLDVHDANRFASSHYETNNGEEEVSTPVLQSELEIVSDTDSLGSEEPSPEKALDFVNHFLSENNLSISGIQKTDSGKADPIRSPPEFSAKGALALARRASLSNKPRELKIFDWTAEETTEFHSSKGADKELNSRSRGQSAEKDEGEAVIVDTFDDGFNTQMAAEVMEALIHAHPPTTILQDTHEPQFCKNLKMPGSVPPISTKELERMNTFPSMLNGYESRPLRVHSGYKKECKSQKQWKDSTVCWEPPATKSVSSRRTPLIEKKVIRGRNVRLLSQQKVDENSEIERLAGGRGKQDSSKFTQCQQSTSTSTTKRNKRKSSERLSEVSKSPVKCFIRSISNYLDLAVPKKRRTGKFRDSRSNGLLWTTTSIETQPGGSKCSLFGPSIPFKLYPLCYMKKKRTHRGVPHRSVVSPNSSTLPSGKSSKQKAEQKTMPGLNNCGYVHMDRDRKASNCSREGDIMVSKENVNLNVVGAGSDLSRTSEKHGSSFLLAKEVTRLGCAKSLPNFFPKKLRRRKNENVRVLFSQHLESKILNQQKKIIARLGFSVASCCSDATHFVTDRYVRTRNMLEAMSLGKPVVTHCWLKSCDQANYCVDEERYILRDVKKEKEIGFSMPITLASASKNPLLMGRTVFITPNVQPGLDLIQSLVNSVHGKVVERIAEAEKGDGCIPKDLLILSCREDYAKCVPLIKKGAAIYDSELLLNGIVIQKLEFERHQLFTEYARSIGSRKRPRSR